METSEVEADGNTDVDVIVGATETVGFNEVSEPDISPPGIRLEFDPAN